MNPYALNARTITYVEDFLDETIHLKNRISVKCYVVKMTYGAILKIKVYRRVKVSGKGIVITSLESSVKLI